MKKSLVLTTLVGVGLLLAYNANAQTSPWKKKQDMEQVRPFSKMYANQGSAQNQHSSYAQQQRATATQNRLRSYVGFENNGTMFKPYDSTALIWRGNHNKPEIANNIVAALSYYGHPQRILNSYSDFTSEIVLNNALGSYADELADSSNVRFLWGNSSNAFAQDSKINVNLDPNGNVASHTKLSFNGSIWVNEYRILFEYDGQSRLEGKTYQNWDGAAFESEFKVNYVYAIGLLVQQYTEIWDNGSNSWKNDQNTNITYIPYNGGYRVLEYLTKTWDGASYQNYARTTMAYNTGSTTRLDEEWEVSQWLNVSKATTTYNSQNKPLIYTAWEWSMGAFQKVEKNTLSYDGSGNLLTYMEQEWNGTNWESSPMHFTYTHNSANLVKSVMHESYNDIASAYDTLSRITYTYNNDDQCTLLLEESWTGSTWNQNDNGNQKIVFNYEVIDDGTSIYAVLDKNDFSFYPNPAQDKLNIQMNNSKLITGISITDISGRVVYKNQAQLKATQLSIPVSNLTDGVYFIQINSDGQKGAKSFVVKH